MCFGQKKHNNKIQELPKTYKAVTLSEYGKPMSVETHPIPQLQENDDLLIKVEVGAVSVIDSYLIQGLTPSQLPFTPGDEGSGIVVDGKGENAQKMIGKKVSFIRKLTQTTGSYGQYCISTIQLAMEIPQNLSFDQAATGSINPLTVAVMFKKSQDLGAKAVINTAAGGQLGTQFFKFFKSNNIPVINIVRRKEQEDHLKKLGAKHILNQTSENFVQDLKNLATQLQATVGFDAVFGKLSEQVLEGMPEGSTLILYDCLSQETDFQISLQNLLVQRKTITSLNLYYDFFYYSPKEIEDLKQTVSTRLNSVFNTQINKTFTYDQINEVFDYYFQNMSKGKNLIKLKL